ncbi:hypothetical protein [uncultured Polaribacter sp.]|uniref:hypothetical protein n=1 Tax=uncultured Polaribacter sp. TaxID=174711 RepID=UPI00260E6EE2|nr:hypothetical protein [uncultured Polaribacter sp.]
MRFLIVSILFCVFFSACDFFQIQEKENNKSAIIAIVNTEKLFKKDIVDILPQNVSKADSSIIVNSYIQDWAIKQLLLDKAKKNSSLSTVNEIETLVKDYKESLLINSYKEELVQQQLDTVISKEEIESFYHSNKDNFKLNEELIKIRYLHISDKINDKDEIIDLFKSDDIFDLEELEKQELSFKFHQFNDSIWTRLDKVLLKLPFSKENLLKKTKFIQKQDSLGLYLVAIKDVLHRNAIAPVGYIKPTIKQMILHNRKKELIKDIKKIIVKDAIQNNNFKTY